MTMDVIEWLVAIEELKRLKARYFRLVDAKKWDEWGALFEPDVVAEFPDDDSAAVYRGREEFVGSVKHFLGPAVTLHHGHTPELDVSGPESATGVWTMQDWLYWPEDNQIAGVRSLLGWGHYHESYVKTSGHWRISTLKLTRVHRVVT